MKWHAVQMSLTAMLPVKLKTWEEQRESNASLFFIFFVQIRLRMSYDLSRFKKRFLNPKLLDTSQ